jgi:hypothetical protein
LKCIPGDYLMKLVERMLIVLMSSLLFYNVENSKNKEKSWSVSKLLTGTVYIYKHMGDWK